METQFLNKITTRDLNVFYDENQAIFDVNLDIAAKRGCAGFKSKDALEDGDYFYFPYLCL